MKLLPIALLLISTAALAQQSNTYSEASCRELAPKFSNGPGNFTFSHFSHGRCLLETITVIAVPETSTVAMTAVVQDASTKHGLAGCIFFSNGSVKASIGDTEVSLELYRQFEFSAMHTE